jgi:hypothetical protein
LLLGLALIAPAAPAAAQAPDIQAMLDTSLEMALGVDRDRWARHAFKRQVTRQQVDEDGEVEWRQVMLFQVTPTTGGFDEELLEIDGRPPKAKEVAKHRKSGRFAKHYEKTQEVQLENPFGADLPLLPLLYEQQHRYVGEEEVRGIPCHRLRFEARPEPADGSVNEKLRHAMEGTLCLSKEGSRMFHAELGTVRTVTSSGVRINSMRLHFEARKFGDAWLPTLFELHSDVKLPLGVKMRKHNIYRYSDYRLAD